ncbi:unnamed protein product [Toxocara canis]|uniref:Dynein light intermediate chain n=1 Tax=Toxocara canis TaxID=6265 RepID=A0A183U3J7_TOXCA|nr:unnamed protein product [Toxocara canis]
MWSSTFVFSVIYGYPGICFMIPFYKMFDLFVFFIFLLLNEYGLCLWRWLIVIMPANQNAFILGDRQCGKSWLLSRLEKREASGRGSALEYHFLNVHADFRDASYAYQLSTAGAGVAPGETVTLPVWVLDGDESFAPLIKFALTQSLSRSVVVLCASLTQPGAILSSLNRWAKLIDAQIQNIFDKTTIAEARQAQELFWQEYVEPLDSSMHSDKIPSMETEQVRTFVFSSCYRLLNRLT